MSIDLHIEAYGKAVIVKGATRPLKDFLKSKGGKWFPKGGGWMFQGTKKAAMIQNLQSNAIVKSMIDRTSGGGTVFCGCGPERRCIWKKKNCGI